MMIFRVKDKVLSNTVKQQLLGLLVLGSTPLLLYAQVWTKNSSVQLADATTINASGTERHAVSSVKTNASTSVFQLSAAQWELAYQGDDVMSLPALKRLASAWLLDTSKMIEVHYPGGEEGEYWVQQLTDWLVALGIPSKHIVVVPGSGVDDMIKLNLI